MMILTPSATIFDFKTMMETKIFFLKTSAAGFVLHPCNFAEVL